MNLNKMNPEKRIGYIGSRDMEQERKEERKANKEESLRNQKRKHEEQMENEAKNQKTAYSRLEAMLGPEPAGKKKFPLKVARLKHISGVQKNIPAFYK